MSSLQDMVFNAAKDGEVEQLNDLLKNLNRFDRNLVLGPKTHPNGETTTPLIMAALYSQHEVIDLLMQHYGTDIEQTGMIDYDGHHLHSTGRDRYYISHLAYTFRRRRHGLNEDEEDGESRKLEETDRCVNGVTALWLAALKGYSTVVEQLVEKYGADVNHAAMDGSTPLRVACVSGYSRVGSFLIEHGAHVDATMSDNSTSLMVAALQGNRHEVKMLVKNGANVNQKTQPQGRTALHYAAQGGDYIIVINLMRNGAEFCEDLQGFTPIHMACLVHDSDILEYLLSNFDCSAKQRIEAIELLGAGFIKGDDASDEDLEKCWEQWRDAMEERYEDMENIIHKRMLTDPSPIYTKEQESQSMEELIAIKGDKEAIIFEAIMAQERILGDNTMLHSEHIATFLRERGNQYANDDNYEICVAFWLKAIAIRKQADECVSDDITKFAQLFEDREEHGIMIDVKILFKVLALCIEDTQNEYYRLTHSDNFNNIRKSQQNVDQSIYFILFLLQKLNHHTRNSDELRMELTKYITRFNNLHVTASNGNTILHICCDDGLSNDNTDLSNAMASHSNAINAHSNGPRIKDPYVRHALSFPNLALVELLLESGTDISGLNYNNETALHTLAKCEDFEDRRDSEVQSGMQRICRALIDYGVHMDARQNQGLTAQDCANLTVALYMKQNRVEIPLKCLSAQIVKQYVPMYEEVLPKSLVQFVKSH